MAARRNTELSELQAVQLLERTFGKLASSKRARADVQVGIGDDAAVLSPAGPLVWTIDDSVEDVHFKRSWLSLEQAAERAVHAAVSDLAAMGARPLAALISVQFPDKTGRVDLMKLSRGQLKAARALECPVVGGNLTRGPVWRFTTSVLGHCARPVLRRDAKPGHELWLLGDVGLAACGRLALEQGFTGRSARERSALTACVRAWRKPVARIADGLSLRGGIHAAIDVSDGLALDAQRLAVASGVRLVVGEAQLRAALRPALRVLAAALNEDALVLALTGGEDYALLASGPAATRPRGAKLIGGVEKGRGVFLEGPSQRTPLRGGFQHLGDR